MFSPSSVEIANATLKNAVNEVIRERSEYIQNCQMAKVIDDIYHMGRGMPNVSIDSNDMAVTEHVSTDQWFNESVRFEDHINK